MTLIRELSLDTDRALLRAFLSGAADYILLETGEAPDDSTLDDFFTEEPPGGDPSKSFRLGLFKGDALLGVASTAFGFPGPQDAYLGLMLFAPSARGQGLGPTLLSEVETRARDLGARRLYLGVLDENPRGRAFWEAQGFRHVLTRDDMTYGRRTHVVHRLVKDLASD